MNSTEETENVESMKAPKRPARNRAGGGRGRLKSKAPCNKEPTHVQGEDKRRGEEIDESSPVIQAFRCYQVALDAKHDKYERLVKKSRDVTIESKRVIFLLHRITSDSDSIPILKETEEKLNSIRVTSLLDIAVELENEDIYQYLRAISPGLQEYVEAVTFYSYLKNETISSLSEVEKDFHFQKEDSEVKLILPPAEYMLGLADLSGELMRRGINSVTQGNMEVPFKLCVVLRNLFEGFNSLGMAGREISRKTRVLKQSLEKVERACYNINVRGSEIPKHMLTNVFSSEQLSPSRETPQSDNF